MFLRVVNWEDHFEKKGTRELKRATWVPFPNKHDGDGYTQLLDHADGPAHFGCWCALAQVASKCEPRGTLVKDTGQPHDIGSLSRMTRIPQTILRDAIARLISPIGWLEDISQLVVTKGVGGMSQEGATKSQQSATAPALQDSTGQDKTGQNTEECSEGVKARPSLPPPPPQVLVSPDQLVYPTFGCVKGRRRGSETWNLTTAYLAELQESFPAVDVAAQAREAWQWHKTNWPKRKTSDGMPDFLRRWMAREQNRGGTPPRNGTTQQRGAITLLK